MEFIRKDLLSWFLILCVLTLGIMVTGLPPCNYPAIYNFGDSNSDTGGMSAAFQPVAPPYGETFFGKPTGRICDGRLIIDFTAEHLGLPYLSAYLDSINTNFQHGANFATGGSTIRPQNKTFSEGGFSPFSLNVQMMQFDQFKLRVTELYTQGKNPCPNLPKPEDFSKSLFTFDIGQNDLAAGFQTMSDTQVRALIPDILDQFSIDLHGLYQQGARTFWIHNTGPIGCLPTSRTYFFGSEPGFYDQNGCVKSHNDVAIEFNKQLKERVIGLRKELQYAVLTYVDVYSAKYELISNTKMHGFVDPMQICCGHHEEGYHVWCGQKMNINGTDVYGGSCGNPSTYVSWDGVHYSQAANQWIANHILNSALSDPPHPITEACYK